MLKKALKIKGVEGRTALVEFAVNKRVKYLEYLKEIHSEEGTLWMNTVHLNLRDIGLYFNIAAACLPPGREGPTEDALIQLPAERSLAIGGPGSSGSGANPHSSISGDTRLVASSAGETEEDVVLVSLHRAPAALRQRSSTATDWARYYLPCYTALAVSLSDILLLPVGGEDFVECFYGLLLELDVAYASGAATKALAQRNLRQFRQHVSPNLRSLLQAPTDMAAASAAPVASQGAAALSSDHDAQIKYLFLDQRHLEYTAAPPSYDAVIPALCSVLMFAYRKLCDYELMKDEACVHRILSIDKRLERLLFAHLSHELNKISNQKLLREAYVLSTGALFADLGAAEGHNGTGVSALSGGPDFVTVLLTQQQQQLQEQQQQHPLSNSHATPERDFDSSDDEGERTGWSGQDDEL